jgi:hypothetical protein
LIITLPWHQTAKVEPGRTYTALLGAVQLQSVLLLPSFVQFGARIERQMKRTPGVIGFRTVADVPTLKFYHLSTWVDGASIHEFVHTAPHLHAMRKMDGKLGVTTFRYWEVEGSELPLHLKDQLHRLVAVACIK